MKTFILTVAETHYVQYAVEAESVEDACHDFIDNDGLGAEPVMPPRSPYRQPSTDAYKGMRGIMRVVEAASNAPPESPAFSYHDLAEMCGIDIKR